MPVFHQPIRIEQQLCSIAQFGGTKIPCELKNGDVTMMPKTFSAKDATKLNKKKRAKCFKVNRMKAADFIRSAQMVK